MIFSIEIIAVTNLTDLTNVYTDMVYYVCTRSSKIYDLNQFIFPNETNRISDTQLIKYAGLPPKRLEFVSNYTGSVRLIICRNVILRTNNVHGNKIRLEYCYEKPIGTRCRNKEIIKLISFIGNHCSRQNVLLMGLPKFN